MPESSCSVVSWKIHHQLREILNVVAASLEKKPSKELMLIFDKLSSVTNNIHVKDAEKPDAILTKKKWLKALWITDNIAGVLPYDFCKLTTINSKAAIEAAKNQQIPRGEYQIVLIDAPLFKYMHHYVRFLDENSLKIRIGKARMNDSQSRHFCKVEKEMLLENGKELLPKYWQAFVQKRTMERFSKSGIFKILSVEDDGASQDALKALLNLYPFVQLTLSSNVKEAQDELLEQAFDLIVLDLGLPNTGYYYSYEVALLIRDIQKKKGDFFCPIVVNTGHKLTADNDFLFRNGINEFYRKPGLLRNLDQMLARYVPVGFLA